MNLQLEYTGGSVVFRLTMQSLFEADSTPVAPVPAGRPDMRMVDENQPETEHPVDVANRFLKPLLNVLLVCIANTIFVALPMSTTPMLSAQTKSTSAEPPTSPSTTNWRGQRMALERQFGDELQAIAQWCRDNRLKSNVAPTLSAYQNRDLGRQYIYLPSDVLTAEVKATGDAESQWLDKIKLAKATHAERILQLATQASQQQAGAVAYQLLHEVLHYDPNHAGVREMLGHTKTDDGWRAAPDSVRVKTGSKPHDVVSWRAKNYLRVLTPHFEIESNASPERTRFLADQLERAHSVWRQVFFEYWSSPKAVERWIEGNGSARMPRKRFRVVFFVNRDSYLQEMEPLVRGIGVSTGYYSSKLEISFFYDGDAEVQDTWRHELTHQLFRESGRANEDAFESQFIWLDEGIATYFESMTDYGSFVTLGGFESRRLQYARIRRLLEGFHVPVEELSAIGREQLQSRSDMVRIYSEAAGLTEMLMNDENGALEKPLTEFLKLIYKGRIKDGTFEEIMGKTFAELDARYPEYLKVNSQVVEQHLMRPLARTELSLPAAGLSRAAFEAIGRCHNLNWLDLSQNKIGSGDLKLLQACTNINQLILTECRFDKDSLASLLQFQRLDELDLSGSQVQDFQLADLEGLTKLRSLRLTATAISDRGIQHLAKLRGLRSLDLSQTRVTAQGVAQLKTALPAVQIKH